MSRSLLPRDFSYAYTAQAYYEWSATRSAPDRLMRLRGSLARLGAVLDVARAACTAWVAFERMQPGLVLGERAWFESAGMKSAHVPVTRSAADAAAERELLDFPGQGHDRSRDPLDQYSTAEITVTTTDPQLAAVLLALGASVRCDAAEWTAHDLEAWFEKNHSGREPDHRWREPGPLGDVVDMKAPAVGSAEELTRWMSEVDLSSWDAQRVLGEAYTELRLINEDGDAIQELIRSVLLQRICEGRLNIDPEATHWLFFNADNNFVARLQRAAKDASEKAYSAFLDWMLSEDVLVEVMEHLTASCRLGGEPWWSDLNLDSATVLERGLDVFIEAMPLRALALAADGRLDVHDPVGFVTTIAQNIDLTLAGQLEGFERVEVGENFKSVLGTKSSALVYEVLRGAVHEPDRVVSFEDYDEDDNDD